MAKQSKCTYSLVRGLYGELERARREYENDPQSEGGIAYGLWLELFEIADWHLEGAPGIEGDSADLEGAADAEELDPHDAGVDRQLVIPGTRGMDADVPRGTQRQPRERVAVVGAQGLTPVGSNEQKGVIRGSRRTLP